MRFSSKPLTIRRQPPDPTVLGYFAPKNGRQTVEAALPGGDLLVAFENAWETGSEKDRAARQGK